MHDLLRLIHQLLCYNYRMQVHRLDILSSCLNCFLTLYRTAIVWREAYKVWSGNQKIYLKNQADHDQFKMEELVSKILEQCIVEEIGFGRGQWNIECYFKALFSLVVLEIRLMNGKHVKYSRLELQNISFSRSGTAIWNCLPVGLKMKSRIILKNIYKLYF